MAEKKTAAKAAAKPSKGSPAAKKAPPARREPGAHKKAPPAPVKAAKPAPPTKSAKAPAPIRPKATKPAVSAPKSAKTQAQAGKVDAKTAKPDRRIEDKAAKASAAEATAVDAKVKGNAKPPKAEAPPPKSKSAAKGAPKGPEKKGGKAPLPKAGPAKPDVKTSAKAAPAKAAEKQRKSEAKAEKPTPIKAEQPSKPEKPATGDKRKTETTAKPVEAQAAAEKPAKSSKSKAPPKPAKLPPVAAAFAKPMPVKPLAVAAGRAEPITRALATPAPRVAPKPLAAPKPVSVEAEQVGDAQAVPAFKGGKSSAKGMVLVGAIAGAFGVKGELRLRAFTEKCEGVISYGPLYGEDGKVLLKPKTWRALKDGVAVVTPEVKTREQAEAMKGQRLFVPRANLPATAEDEFYVVDLLGSRAEALDGAVLGDIVAVWNFGAGDILEYRPPNGGPNVRVVFTKETVPHVDLAAKRVVIDPPAPETLEK